MQGFIGSYAISANQRSDPTDLEQTGDVRTVYEIQRLAGVPSSTEPRSLTYQLNKRCKNLPPKSLHSLIP